MPSEEFANEPYHDSLGVEKGDDGDVFVRTDSEQTIPLTQREALKLAGQLLRMTDEGFHEDHRESRINFADMALEMWVAPEGPGGDVHQLDKYEWVDDGAWAWYSKETDATLEFWLTSREGFDGE